ncbi:hypothetical protein [Sphingomonas sp.]|uniref:hypothetical protein n=1 Tax=Sphingomonas sp. TaxID=28214 RepID=UPI003B3B4C05
MKAFCLGLIALTACSGTDEPSRKHSTANIASSAGADRPPNKEPAKAPTRKIKRLPPKYINAFMCNLDENPIAAYKRYHGTPAGRAARAEDLTALRSLGFSREGRDGDLESVGGKIPAPLGMTLFGLPVRSVEINGMIGDANAMYVTTFASHVTVDQVTKSARLQFDERAYRNYKVRFYSRMIARTPYTELYLDDLPDRNGGDAMLVCHIQSTPH